MRMDLLSSSMILLGAQGKESAVREQGLSSGEGEQIDQRKPEISGQW